MKTQNQAQGQAKPFVFTGKHMLCVMIAFFSTIIVVNVTMARLAGSTWTGLVVENSYVASQEFNRKLEEGRAQLALNWTSELKIGDGTTVFRLTDRDGKPVFVKSARALFRHPSFEQADWSFDLQGDSNGDYSVSRVPPDGMWLAEIEADAGLARPYRDIRRIYVRKGHFQ